MSAESHVPDVVAPLDASTADVERRVEATPAAADLRPVVAALHSERERLLSTWLEVAARQPFHEERPEAAVADHIPTLFDALLDLISRLGPPGVPIEAPMDDEVVIRAARAHAQMRFEHRLGPVAIATEFRILRQEVSRALQRSLDSGAPAQDVVAAIAVVDDALDGATSVALATLTERIEVVREEFLASTVHDVRQPITLLEASLVLAARWLRREPLEVERLAETLEGALYATQEISQLIDTLADASRVAMGAVELDREPVIAAAVVEEALDLLEPTSRARVDVEPMSRDAIGDWDRRAIRRIVTNLLSNALKYSPPDQRVQLDVRFDDERVTITVVDRGIGLLPDELAVLFRRYGRTEDARARGLPGLGMGLYAAQGLARAHGGRVVLESEGRDRGTTARLDLPRAQE